MSKRGVKECILSILSGGDLLELQTAGFIHGQESEINFKLFCGVTKRAQSGLGV